MTKQKSVPWWTAELATKRKRLNALRRLYQRTKNNEELRNHRKTHAMRKGENMQQQLKSKKLSPGKSIAT